LYVTTPDQKYVNRQAAQKRRHALRAKAIEYKGGCCTICKYDMCHDGLDFHHTSKWGKDFSISEKMTSWERIKPELDKTVLLCSRCHREVHAGMHPSFLDLDDP
jgi:uncharacterized protein (DUF2237 family)